MVKAGLSGDSCGMCLERFEEQDSGMGDMRVPNPPVALPCFTTHRFHESCLVSLMLHEKNARERRKSMSNYSMVSSTEVADLVTCPQCSAGLPEDSEFWQSVSGIRAYERYQDKLSARSSYFGLKQHSKTLSGSTRDCCGGWWSSAPEDHFARTPSKEAAKEKRAWSWREGLCSPVKQSGPQRAEQQATAWPWADGLCARSRPQRV